MAKALKVLILEDRPSDAELMVDELRQVGFEPDWERVQSEEEYVERLGPDLDVILADYALPQFNAMAALRLLQERDLEIPFLVITGVLDGEAAVTFMKQGADDFLRKDRLERLGPAVDHALTIKRLRDESRAARREASISARQWEATFDAISDPLFLLDAGGRIVRCNQATVDFLKRPRTEIVGRPCCELVHGSSRHIEGCPYNRALETLERESLVWQVEDRWLEATVDPMLDAEGYLVGFAHLLEDITERKEAEEAVRRRARELELLNRAGRAFNASLDLDRVLGTVLEEVRSLLGVAGCSIWLKEPDSDGLVCRQVSGPQSETVRGWRLAPGEGIAGWAFLHDESVIVADTEADERYFEDVDEETGLGLRSILTVPLRSDGGVLGVLQAVDQEVGRFDVDDAALLRSLTASATLAIEKAQAYERAQREIAERRQVEAALRKAEARYRTLFEETPIGLYRTTPDGEILEANPALAEILGYPDRESLLRVDARDLYLDPEDRKRNLEALDSPDHWDSVEIRLRRGDGRIIWVLDTGRAIEDDEGEIRYYDGALQDITERKKAREALHERTEELAALQATVLDITAEHDLSTVLNTVVEQAVNLLDARAGGMYLCDLDRREVKCVVSYNTPDDYTGAVLAYGEGAAGTVAESAEALIVDDYRSWRRRASSFEEEPFTAVLTVPMIWQGEVIGTLDVLDDVEERRFTERDEELLTLFANHAAIAVENARLYEEAQEEIAQREEVVDALRESERRYRLLFERNLAGLYRTTPEGEILDCNEAFVRLLGYGSREEMMKARAVDLYFDEATRDVLLKELRDDGVVNSMEWRMRGSDGEPIWVLENATLVEESDRTVIEGALIDITERRRAEERVRFQARLLDAVGEAVIATDSDGTVIYWNRAAEELYGWSEEEVLDRNILEVTPALGSEEQAAEILAQLRAGKSWSGEFRVQRRDGTPFYALVTNTPILDEEGNLEVVIGVSRDITARKQAGDELMRRADNLRAINEFAINLASAERGVDHYSLVARELKGITDALAVSVSVYDAEERDLVVHHVVADGRVVSRVNDLLGERIVGFRTPVSREMYADMVTEIVRTTPDLSETTFGKIPKPIAGMIGRVLHVDRFVGLALVDGGELMGTAVLVFEMGKCYPSDEVLHTFARVAATSLRQREVEAALHERLKELRCLYAVYEDMQRQLPREQFCERIVDHLKTAMQFPEITVPVIELDGSRFSIEGATEELGHCLHSEVKVGGETCGKVWVHYTENRPFLIPEEQDLVDGVAEALGLWLERREAATALRESVQRLRTLFEDTMNPIMVVDENQRYVGANEAALEFLECTLDELRGKEMWAFTPPDQLEQEMEAHTPFVSRRTRELDYLVNGKIKTLLLNVIPVTISNQVYLYGIGQDITERKQAEDRLARRQRELATLLEISRRLTSELELETVLDIIANAIVELLPAAEASSLWLHDGERDALIASAWSGHEEQAMSGLSVSPDMSLVGLVYETGNAQVIDDAPRDASFTPFGRPQLDAVRSAVGVPLRVKDQVIGAVFADNFSRAGAFHDDDVELLESLGAQAAIAIHNAHLYEAENAARRQLRDLTSYLQNTREEERARIAREIHDEFGQMVTALKMDLAWLGKRLPESKPELVEKASTMAETIDETLEEVRRVSSELRPSALDDLGLAAAIEWQAESFAERSGIGCELRLDEEGDALDRRLATALFRILQEALTNVARHAEANRVRIELKVAEDEVTLTVEDDGRGITPSELANSDSLGLMGMQERARTLGGDVTIEGQAGQGTRVTASIPRRRDASGS